MNHDDMVADVFFGRRLGRATKIAFYKIMIKCFTRRDIFDTWRTEIIHQLGIKDMPQDVNDALTRKDLELKRKGE